MKTSQNGINLIKQFEGCRLKPYLDAVGIPTIGYGNTHYLDGTRVKLSDKPISPQYAEKLLLELLPQYEKAVSGCLKNPISQNQFDALVSFCWNVGGANLAKSTLIKKLNAGDINGAAGEFERWNKAGGRILNGLIRRRLAEKSLFLKN